MDSSLTIMTYNIGNGLANPAQLTWMLENSPADIVGLQEVTEAQADAMEKSLSEKYPHQVIFGNGIPGKGLLSKFPIISHEHLQFHDARPDLHVTLDVEGEPLTAIVAHPCPPRLRYMSYDFLPSTQAQFDCLFDLCSSDTPTILLGDFNMIERHAFYNRFAKLGLIDAFRSVSNARGYTIPQRVGGIRTVPFLRIDYIWHSAHFKAIEAWVGQDAGSDHLPVVAQLEWAKQNE